MSCGVSGEFQELLKGILGMLGRLSGLEMQRGSPIIFGNVSGTLGTDVPRFQNIMEKNTLKLQILEKEFQEGVLLNCIFVQTASTAC